jgi:uncharacterized protein YndB with AHSA1/START domain
MTDATIITSNGRPTVRLERHLVDSPPVVWHALTDPEQLRSWFPCDVVVEGGVWKVGAAITFPFPPDIIEMTLAGEVLEVVEPTRLAYTWGEDTLRFELGESKGGTLLVLYNELSASSAARNAAGWDDCLDRLAHLSAKPDAWKIRFGQYQRDFEPVLGPQDGPPAGYKGIEHLPE